MLGECGHLRFLFPDLCNNSLLQAMGQTPCVPAAGGVEEESTIFLSAELSDSAWAFQRGVPGQFKRVLVAGKAAIDTS